MKINIKSTNIDLTPAISEYVNKKLEQISRLIKKEDTGVLCDVEVGRTTYHHKSGDIYRAEINLKTEGQLFYASAEREDLYFAIDEVKDEIKNKLSAHKTKKETLLRRGGRSIKKLLKGLKRKE